MPPEPPAWRDAQLVVTHRTLRVGVFPSTKSFRPREKERRWLGFTALDEGASNAAPQGGQDLPALKSSGGSTAEYQGVTVMAGEAGGHTVVKLLGGGDDWTVVVGADAWIALGPNRSQPEAVQIGPHVQRFGPPIPSSAETIHPAL